MEFIEIGSIWTALIITAALAVIHLISIGLSKIPFIGEKGMKSFGGGMAAAYVFLHMLPELVEGNEPVGRLLEHRAELTPMVDLAIFVVAFIGFNLYYAFEILARRQKEKKENLEGAYVLHLSTYTLHNVLITYTMPLRVQTGFWYSLVFTLAVGFHFFIADRALNEHFPKQFQKSGRAVLISALFLGWIISAITDPVNVMYAALLIAFLSGSILFTVFKEEIPSDKESKYGWFVAGSALMSILLIILTFAGARGSHNS